MECNISENNSNLANQKRLRTGAHVYTMSQSMKMPILVNTIRNNFIFTAHLRRSFRIPTRIYPRFSVSIFRNNLNFFSAILVFTCVINSVHSNSNHTSFKSNKAVSNLTRKSDDPINVYRDKLGLFSHSGAWESTEGYDPALIFSDVVNVSPSDDLVNQTSAPPVATEAPTVSAESSCVGDCPLALPLVASAEKSGFRPNVLPKWSTIMANRQRSNPKLQGSNTNKNKPQVKEEDPLESSATAQWRIFKYVNHPDELVSLNGRNSTSSAPVGGQSLNETMLSSYEEYKILSNISSSEEERFFNESLTSTERSLIRNHYFGESKDSSNKNETQKPSGNDTLALDAFRPRRSPYRPHWRQDKLYTHREALYQMAPPSPNLHPPPPGLAVVQSVVLPSMGPQRPLPGSQYVPKPAPPPATMHSQSSLPVRSVQGFNHHGQLRTPVNNMNGGESPEESPSFRLPNFHHPFAKPKPMKMNRPDGRNLPPGQRRPHPPGHGGRRPPPRGRPGGNGPVPSVMSPPRPIPVPRPGSRPSQGQGPVRIPASSGGGHGPMHGAHASPLRSPPGPPPIQYTYPKNAENIQDILTYFNAADNEIPGTAGKSNPDQSSPSSGLDAFSNELKEIHGSLLKDIREFAKRPSLLDADAAREQTSKSNSNSIPVPRPSMQSLIDEDDDDEPLTTKPKPVRELVNYRERERDDDREDERDRERSRDRHRQKEEEDTYSSYDSPQGGYESKGKRNRKPTYSTSTYKPEDKRHHRDEEEEEVDISEDEERNRRPSSKPRHRIPDREETYSKSRPSSYDDRPTYAPPTKYSRPDESDERLRPSQNYIQFVQDSRERHRLHQERIRTTGRTKSHRPKSHKSKSKSSKSRRHKYHHQQSDGSQNYNRYPSRDDGFRHRHRQTSETAPPSHTKPLDAMDIAYYKQRNRPVVIKRPYQPYRPVDIQKLEKERQKQDQYWNSVSTINVNKARDNAKEQSRKQAIQNHYHYYGVNPTASPSTPPAYDDRKRQAAYTPTMLTSNSSPEEEDVLEIHTGRPPSSIPITTPAYPFPEFDPERDRKAKLQKMYMEYLQRKLEAQAEAQADAMLTSTPQVYPQLPSTSTHKPKRPMRMKIHIYPNEQVQVVDQNNRAIYRSTPVTPPYVPSVQRPYVPSSAYTNNYYHQRPTQNTYSSKPYTPSSYLNSYTNYRNPHHRSSQVSPGTVHVGNGRNFSPPPNNPADKNRNVVLHLHVHRRNGVETDPETGMMMAGSDHTISTAKPLTYDEIYANSGNDNANVQGMLPLGEQFDKGHPGQSSNRNSNSGENGQRKLLEAVDTDKSISMELPIHQDKVEDVLSTLLKLRE